MNDLYEALEVLGDGSSRYGSDFMYAINVGVKEDGSDLNHDFAIVTLDCYAGQSGMGSTRVDLYDFEDMVEGVMDSYNIIVGNIVKVNPSRYADPEVLFGLEVEVALPFGKPAYGI